MPHQFSPPLMTSTPTPPLEGETTTRFSASCAPNPEGPTLPLPPACPAATRSRGGTSCIQGALGSRFLEPLYLAAIVIGEVSPEMREIVREDCERAFWSRLGDINGTRLLFFLFYHVIVTFPNRTSRGLHHTQTIYPFHRLEFCPLAFCAGRAEYLRRMSACFFLVLWVIGSIFCIMIALVWISDSGTHHVLINGMKRGVAPKHRYREKSR
jgi:tRNA-specific adenosine deaminase 1